MREGKDFRLGDRAMDQDQERGLEIKEEESVGIIGKAS